jgi:large conductance mechanosensitive channel
VIKRFISEFRKFALRGNAIDMAVGIIVGSVLTGLVNSFVAGILMPPIGVLIGNFDFSKLAFHLTDKATLNIGLFANSIISFAITMLALFSFVKVMNRLHVHKDANARECPYCKSEINAAAVRCPNCCSDLKDSR